MKNTFRLNSKYIGEFRRRVNDSFILYEKRSLSNFLKSLFKEITRLFNSIGGQISNKNNVPQINEYPDSDKVNNLIHDICFDIDKLYKTQNIIEEDLNALLNFNDYHRDQIFNDYLLIEHNVNKEYISNINGGIDGNIFTEYFDNNAITGNGSENVLIDENRGVLTLSSETEKVENIIDTDSVEIIFHENTIPNTYPKFPLSNTLSVGSHWKKYLGTDPHFIDETNDQQRSKYKTRMIDDINASDNIGYCEFESVFSNYTSGTGIIDTVKTYVGKKIGKDSNNIYLNRDSIQSKYCYFSSNLPDLFNQKQTLKLTIPLLPGAEVFTNQFDIDFSYMSNGNNAPAILFKKSRAISTDGTEYHLVDSRHNGNGIYTCIISSYINLKSIELILDIGTGINSWEYIDWVMGHWQYTNRLTYTSATARDAVHISIEKVYDIFVDRIGNEEEELSIATNIIKGTA